jgi:hypothetical protein
MPSWNPTLPPDAGTAKAPRVDLGEHTDVVPRVRHDRRLARRPGRGVDPHNVLAGDGEHAVGVDVPELGLVGERQLPDLVDRVDHAGTAQLLLPERRVRSGHPPEGLLQATGLEAAQRIGAEILDFESRHATSTARSRIMRSTPRPAKTAGPACR